MLLTLLLVFLYPGGSCHAQYVCTLTPVHVCMHMHSIARLAWMICTSTGYACIRNTVLQTVVPFEDMLDMQATYDDNVPYWGVSMGANWKEAQEA